VSELVVIFNKEPVALTVPVPVVSISLEKQVAPLTVNSEQLEATLGILLSTLCAEDLLSPAFGSKLLVVISSAEVVRVNIIAKNIDTINRISHHSYKYD